jgi:hypothetical protein
MGTSPDSLDDGGFTSVRAELAAFFFRRSVMTSWQITTKWRSAD